MKAKPNPVSAQRRRKKQSVNVHDRRAKDALAVLQAVPVIVKNPHDLDGGEIVVLASTRDDILRRMVASEAIDAAQFAAGRAWEADWERAQLGHTSSGGQWRERVNGGGVSGEIITDQIRRAVKNLARADRELGQHGCQIVRDILGRGMTTTNAAIKYRGKNSQRSIDYINTRFRECLETLVAVYQMGGGK